MNVGDRMEIKVATIDTILTFYLAFLYTKKIYYYKDRLLCISEYLYDLQEDNRLSQKGLLKRFSMDCYGKQPTMEDIRAEKASKYAELSTQRNTHEYDEWFLNYKPAIGKKDITKTGNAKKLNDKKIARSPSVKNRIVVKKDIKSKKKTQRKKRAVKQNDYLF